MQKNKRRTELILLGLFCLSIHLLLAQNYPKLDVSLANRPLKEFLSAIEKQTDYSFMYNNLNVEQTVTVDVKQKTLPDILDQVFSPLNIYYEVAQTRIFLRSEEQRLAKGGNPITVAGRITDRWNDPLAGATVRLKDGTTGTITDMDGYYSLLVPANSILVCSYIGYDAREIAVNSRNRIDIVLEEDSKLLQEVVVVGYGIQKRVNLTGAVAAVGGDVLEARPLANAITGLQGTLPGVTIINSGSRPGDSTTSIRIRGIGSLNDSNPLILIDGIEGNLSILNPDDIASVSVLKDAASSAIYGSRAANGVVLVTTKKAYREKKPTIHYNGAYSLQMPVNKPEMLDAAEYLLLLKEATANVNKNWGYTHEDVETIRNGSDPNYFANTNWVDELYRNIAPQHSHNVSINGGSQTMGYYASYGYLGTDGLLVGNSYHATRNNARLKLDTEVLDRINLEANISYTDVDNWTPSSSDDSSDGMFYRALRSSPLVPVRFDDDRWGYGGSSGNPVALMQDGGFINYKSQETTLNFTGSLRIIDGLSAKVQYGVRQQNVLRKAQSNIVTHYYPGTDTFLAYSSSTSRLQQRDVSVNYQALNAQIDYDKTFGKHAIQVLAGFGQEWQHQEQMDGSREDLVSDNLHVLNAGTDKQLVSGSAYHWALRSGFGRINYNYNDRYLVEVNMRYDLSSRFHKDHRGGYFPSASLGWRISEENFAQPIRNWLENLKLRVSYGTLGNQYTNIGNTSYYYPYMATIQSGSSMPFGGNLTTSMEQAIASNQLLTWETIQMTNIGIDISILNNRLAFTGDYFVKNTKDILLSVKLPDVLGVTEPFQNAGKVRNKGWEINLAWNDKIGKDFTYGVHFNLSDVKNKVVSMGDTADDFSGNQVRAVGYPINSFWGYVADGLAGFDDFDYDPVTDTYNAKIPIIEEYRTKFSPGDIKYKDLDGSGDITKEDDRTYLGSPIPRYLYTFGANLKWKDLDFQFFFQGVGQCEGWINGLGRYAFTELANYPQKVHLDRWTMENPNPKASYPRFTYEENYNTNNLSSFWIEDASYLRLKNVQVGYTLPDKIMKPLRVENCRIYFSGENLLTFTNFFKSYDPETPVSGGGYYPVTKSVSFGINLTLR